MWEVITRSRKETINLGYTLGRFLKCGDIVLLWGELGTGKTVFAKGISLSKGIDSRKVDSASFVLLKIYEGSDRIFHYDFFRIHSPDEIVELGFFEYVEEGISVVEWPHYLIEVLGEIPFLEVFIEHFNRNWRKIRIISSHKRFKTTINKLKKEYRG